MNPAKDVVDIPAFVLTLNPLILDVESCFPQLSNVQAIEALDARGDSRWDATDWCIDNGARVDVDSIARREGARPTPTQLACALGHHMIYALIVEQGLPYALVLEEDARQVGDLRYLANSKDLLLRKDVPTVVQLSSRGQVFTHRRNLEPGTTQAVVALTYPPRQTTAYLINFAAATAAASAPVDGLADWPGFATSVCFYAVLPWPFRESGAETTIQLSAAGGNDPTRRETRWRYLPRSGSSEYLYRTYLPRLDSWLWRMRRRPRIGPGGALWKSSIPWMVVALIRNRARRKRNRQAFASGWGPHEPT